MSWETHYINTVSPDLRTLKHIKDMFTLHSDGSAHCNGYRSLCSLIEEMDKISVVVIENEIKIDGNTIRLSDKSGIRTNQSQEQPKQEAIDLQCLIGELKKLLVEKDKLIDELREEIKIRELAILDWQDKPATIEGDAVEFAELFQEFIDFSIPTFKEATALSSLEKLDGEIKEVAHEIQHGHENLVVEYVDCFMCLLDSMARMKISIAELNKAFVAKLAVNKNRTWVKNADSTYSHLQTI